MNAGRELRHPRDIKGVPYRGSSTNKSDVAL